MTRAAIYARISRDRAGAGLGVDRQAAECRELATRRGWDVVATFIDNDISAFSGKVRPQYEALLGAIEGGRVEAVLAWHNDRLHRSPKELERFIDLVEHHKVAVAVVQGGDYDLTTSNGRLSARIVGAVARHESEHKSERLRSKMRQLAADGRWRGGNRHYGYERGYTAVCEAEAIVIRQVAGRVLGGEPTARIVADLNRYGIPTANGARIWHGITLKGILRSPALSSPPGGQCPPVLDDVTSARLRAVLKHGKVTTQRTLLASVLVCGNILKSGEPVAHQPGELPAPGELDVACGRPMGSRPQHGRPAYACRTELGGCGSVTVMGDFADEFVSRHVIAVLDTRALAAMLNDEDNDEPAALFEIERAKAEMVELADLDAPLAFKAAQANALQRKIEAAEAKVAASARSNILRLVQPGQLASRWPSLTVDQRRAVIRSVVTRVECLPTGKGRQGRANRLAIHYRGRLDPANVAKAAAVLRAAR